MLFVSQGEVYFIRSLLRQLLDLQRSSGSISQEFHEENVGSSLSRGPLMMSSLIISSRTLTVISL